MKIAQQPVRIRGQNYFPSELFFCGISLTEAFAHPHTGDTALSTMIGGLKTIRNGRRGGFSRKWRANAIEGYLQLHGQCDVH
eukprot:611312-Rhodomonas_salina.1